MTMIQDNQRTRRKTWSSATSPTKNPECTDPGLKSRH